MIPFTFTWLLFHKLCRTASPKRHLCGLAGGRDCVIRADKSGLLQVRLQEHAWAFLEGFF